MEHPVPIVAKKPDMNYHRSFIPASQEETVGRLSCTGISGCTKESMSYLLPTAQIVQRTICSAPFLNNKASHQQGAKEVALTFHVLYSPPVDL